MPADLRFQIKVLLIKQNNLTPVKTIKLDQLPILLNYHHYYANPNLIEGLM